MGSKKLFGIYLNDHAAAAVGGTELVKRSLRANKGSPLGDYLEKMLDELREDQQIVKELLRRVGVKESKPKQAALWLAEKVGRAKLNGRLRGYSPLSRVIELEGLQMAVTGRLALLRALKELGNQTVMGPAEIERLAKRAEEQRAQLEKFHKEAVRTAFGGKKAARPKTTRGGKQPKQETGPAKTVPAETVPAETVPAKTVPVPAADADGGQQAPEPAPEQITG